MWFAGTMTRGSLLHVVLLLILFKIYHKAFLRMHMSIGYLEPADCNLNVTCYSFLQRSVRSIKQLASMKDEDRRLVQSAVNQSIVCHI